MNTRVVRVKAEDVDLVDALCGLHPTATFASKLHAILARVTSPAYREAELDRLRLVMREELQRVSGGLN